MPRNLDTALLRAFVAVADSGGMTAAGQTLALTQAAVSQQIKRLEEGLGVVLFERGRRGLAPTPDGERLLPRARRLLALNDEIWSEMTTPVETGELRLGVPYDLVPGYMPGVLKSFVRARPRTRVTLLCRSSREIRAAVAAGEVDLGIVEEAATGPEGETLMMDRLVWVGAVGGDAHLQSPVPISIGTEACSIRAPVLAALARAKVDWRPVAEMSNVDALQATVASDLAVTALLASTVPPGLAVLAPDAGLPPLPLLAVGLYRRDGAAGPAADDLAAALRAGFLRRPRAVA